MITDEQRGFFADHGYVVVEGLFSPEEVEHYRDHYMTLRRHGTYPGDSAGVDVTSVDPLKRYPRMIHMHRWDETVPALDAGCAPQRLPDRAARPRAVRRADHALFQAGGSARAGAAPGQLLPEGTARHLHGGMDGPGSLRRGERLHAGRPRQPSVAAPMHREGRYHDQLHRRHRALAAGARQVRPVLMNAGDVLFFNGSLVHGSFPNTTPDRFRRALIGHYIDGAAEQVATYYHPALRMDGTPLELKESVGGGACGVWVEQDGEPSVAMVGQETVSRKHE